MPVDLDRDVTRQLFVRDLVADLVVRPVNDLRLLTSLVEDLEELAGVASPLFAVDQLQRLRFLREGLCSDLLKRPSVRIGGLTEALIEVGTAERILESRRQESNVRLAMTRE